VVVAGENGEIEFREGIRFQGSGRTSTVLCVSGFDGWEAVRYRGSVCVRRLEEES